MLGLVRRSPTLGLSTISDPIIDNFFGDLLDQFHLPNTGLSLPSVDVYSEDDKTMVVEMQAPGLDRKDIQISASNGALEIRGERTEKEEHKDKKRSYMIRETSSSFARRVVLPEGANTDKIVAELDKGVLRVTVPVERAEARRIEITAPQGRGKAKLSSAAGAKSQTK